MIREDSIRISPYDPAWPAAFEAEARRIASALLRALSLGYPRS